MTTSRLTSLGHSAVGKTTHADTKAPSISTNVSGIPVHIAAKFVELAPTLGNKVHIRNEPVYRNLLALCKGDKVRTISNYLLDAAAVLKEEGAEKTLLLLRGAKPIGRPAKFENFRGYKPSPKQHEEFAWLVKTNYAKIAAFQIPLVDAIVKMGQGILAIELVAAAKISEYSLTVHARRLDYFTPLGAFHYFTLPKKVSRDQRREMDQFQAIRRAQGDLPEVPPLVNRQRDVPQHALQVDQARSTDRFVATAESAASNAAGSAPPKTVSLQQVPLPSLPPPAQSTSSLNTKASVKGQVPPSLGAASRTPELPPRVDGELMLDDLETLFWMG
jgi:hypothetical protein